jgi:hypothetical protein
MAICVRCGTQTELYVNDAPLCPAFSDAAETAGRVRVVLQQAERAARQNYESAIELFNQVASDVPSGYPPPDGTDRIHRAGEELRLAQRVYNEANRRLSDFVMLGKIPKDQVISPFLCVLCVSG